MESHCPECRPPHRIFLPRNRNENPPSDGGLRGIGPTQLQDTCANCLAMLHVPHSHDLKSNQLFAYKMCGRGMDTDADADVKPPKEEHLPKIPILSFKDKTRLREVEDCFILEFDPYKSVTTFPLLSTLLYDHDADLATVAEQAEVACRDYPHPRHLCITYSFNSTRHHIHCKMCYCYVCDAPAPCKQWTKQSTFFRHCEATPDIQIWRDLRNSKMRNIYACFDECFSRVESCYEANQSILPSACESYKDLYT